MHHALDYDLTQVFREEVFASLSSIKDRFNFTFINADASREVVQQARREWDATHCVV